jgi:hypothetical protein
VTEGSLLMLTAIVFCLPTSNFYWELVIYCKSVIVYKFLIHCEVSSWSLQIISVPNIGLMNF